MKRRDFLAAAAAAVAAARMDTGTRKDPFDVLLVDKSGGSSVFASYNRT